jgi:uncharacterized protein
MEKERSMNTTNRQEANRPSAAEALTFNVAGLLAEPLGTFRDYEIATAPMDLGDELHQSRGINGWVRLTRTNRGLLVHGKLETGLAEECSRCLKPIDFAVDFEIQEEALPTIDLASGQPLDVEEEPEVLRLTGHHELLLEDEVREFILLGEPIAPLCRDDCPGLCLVCGLELPGGPHDHPDADVDPRLEALRGFKAPE